MLSIKRLTASYDGPQIIKNISLEVKENEIVTIIGPNGAGKSTVLRSIFGLTTIDKSSSIHFLGEEISGLKTKDIGARGISYVQQGRVVFPNLTVEENLEMGAFLETDRKIIERSKHYVYEKFHKLKTRKHQKARTLSGGEQQMVAIGRSLMGKPALLLLDEPSIGLAPQIIYEVFEKLLEIKKDGTSILMVEQNASVALEFSDRAYVLELGENRISGDAKKMKNDPKIGELYLGKRANWV